MTPRFTRHFRVRHYELDAFGQLTDVNLVRYLQEAAIEASTALGLSPDWYREHGSGWVVRRLSVRHNHAARYGDEITVTTWLSLLRGVRSLREYDVTRNRDGFRLARGRAEWVYVNVQSGQPERVPDEWTAAIAANEKPEELGIRLSDAQATDNAHRYVSRRRVRFHEVDANQHVNHAVYLQWIGPAYREALHSAGQKPEQTVEAGHEIQYFAAALDADNIEIVSWLSETAAEGAAWTHEIYNADTRKLLARDYARMSWVNDRHEKIPPPRQSIAALLGEARTE